MSIQTDGWQSLLVSQDERGVVRISLNAPDKRNALSATMIQELTEVCDQLNQCQDTRAVVLNGTGKVFCAGGDLEWMKAQISANRTDRIQEAKKLAMMLHALNTLSKPLIGVVHGGAYGGGAGLCCVCDVVIAAGDTKFGFTETRLGLIPGTISPYVIARMGEGPARRVFMSAAVFDAEKAASLNLVSTVVSADELLAAVEREVEPYLHTAPNAVAASKRLARSLGPVIDEATIDASIKHLADIWETEEAAIGIDAFLKREKPPWA